MDDSNEMEVMMKKVLFVDDEEFILKVIEKKFDPTDIKCFYASSPNEAYALIERNDFDVIVADIQMPNVSGIEFFKRVKKISPRSVRIIMSGYSRTASIIESINEGHIYKYIQKPWKIDEAAIGFINEAIAVSRKWQDKETKECFIHIEDIKKVNKLEEWVLVDTLDQVVYLKSDYPLDLSFNGTSYEKIRSNIGELKLFNLEK